MISFFLFFPGVSNLPIAAHFQEPLLPQREIVVITRIIIEIIQIIIECNDDWGYNDDFGALLF